LNATGLLTLYEGTRHVGWESKQKAEELTS
jgi:hypothetical protein